MRASPTEIGEAFNAAISYAVPRVPKQTQAASTASFARIKA